MACLFSSDHSCTLRCSCIAGNILLSSKQGSSAGHAPAWTALRRSGPAGRDPHGGGEHGLSLAVGVVQGLVAAGQLLTRRSST
jgi:hypothetical protein